MINCIFCGERTSALLEVKIHYESAMYENCEIQINCSQCLCYYAIDKTTQSLNHLGFSHLRKSVEYVVCINFKNNELVVYIRYLNSKGSKMHFLPLTNKIKNLFNYKSDKEFDKEEAVLAINNLLMLI